VIRKRLRKTKVIATIGPACDDVRILERMIQSGMNVARLNFSHGTPDEHHQRVQRLREASANAGAAIAVMVDTRGTEIRTGRLAGGCVDLVRGEIFRLYADGRMGDAAGVSVSYAGLPEEVDAGDPILLDDGSIQLQVEGVEAGVIVCRVERGGVLRDKKGVNLPQTELSIRAAPEGHEELVFAAENDVDYVAASFVQSAKEVEAIRRILRANGADIPIIAKIESRAGVANLGEIVDAADGTMVARGDLGVECPIEEVPMIQKKIIRATVTNGKPVVTATQMLDSMERNPTPTRAEVSDVANAILDGTSAVMLSGETAAGEYPVEAVQTMAMLAREAEASLREYGYLQKILSQTADVVTEAVSQAAITMADHLHATAIMTLTETGFTSRSVSKYRPECPILAITGSERVVRRLSMNWGVTAILYEGVHSDEDTIRFSVRRARELGYVREGDVVVVTAGQHRQAGGTNLIRVVSVDG
jgi:pyruvate kinase